MADRSELAEMFSGIEAGTAIPVIRAFTTFALLANVAEDIHRERRRAIHVAAGEPPQDSSLAATYVKLESAELDSATVADEVELTIVAMGKFDGREIGYGADLDVLFVGEDQRSAQLLTGALAQPSAEGTFTPLDARLRPDGEKGPLVCSLETLRNYYETRAQLWELQALTRARAVTGSLGFEFEALAKELWREAGTRRDLVRQIEDMLVRIANERGCGNDFFDFKTGIGGMIEAEFLVQALQMQHRVWEPNFSSAIE